MSHLIGTASGFRHFIDVLDGFLTDAGHAWGLQYAGEGNGRMTDWAGGVDSVAETITVTMLDDHDFDVVGSVSGALGYGSVGTPFVTGEVEFTIEDGSDPFDAGDAWTLSTSPAWTQLRRTELANITGAQLTGSFSIWQLNDGLPAASNAYCQVDLATPYSFEYEFPAPVTIAEYAITAFNSSRGPRDWDFEYFEESSASWVALDSQVDITWSGGAGQQQVFAIGSPVAATRYRLTIVDINGTPMEIAELDMRTVAGGRSVLEESLVWQAPGNDGQSEIIVGAAPMWRSDLDYYNLNLMAMDAFSSALRTRDQANLQHHLYLPLWDDPMDYWLVANGRRVMGVVKLGSQYEPFVLGFPYNPYFPPSELPYPMGIGGPLTYNDNVGPDTAFAGPANTTDLRYSNTNRAHHAFTHSDRFTSSSAKGQAHDANLRIRKPSGEWVAVFASGEDDLKDAPGFGIGPPHSGTIHPYNGGFSNVGVSLDGDPLLWPVQISDDVGNELGEFDGIYAVSNDGVSAETVIRHGALDVLAFPDINRVDAARFFAMAMD